MRTFPGSFHDAVSPRLLPWRLALVTILQFRERLADRQAAQAVRARIDWKYLLGLELTDPGFNYSVLYEFRARLIAGSAEMQLLEKMLEKCRAPGLLKAGARQRTDFGACACLNTHAGPARIDWRDAARCSQ